MARRRARRCGRRDPPDRIADVVGDEHAAGPVDGDTGYQ